MTIQQRLAQFFARATQAQPTTAPAPLQSVPPVVAVMLGHSMSRAAGVLAGTLLHGNNPAELSLDARYRDVCYLFTLAPTQISATTAQASESDPINELFVGSTKLEIVRPQTMGDYNALFYSLMARSQSRWSEMYAGLGAQLGDRGDLVGALLANEGAQVRANAERAIQAGLRDGLKWYTVPVTAKLAVSNSAVRLQASRQGFGGNDTPLTGSQIVQALEEMASTHPLREMTVTGGAVEVPALPGFSATAPQAIGDIAATTPSASTEITITAQGPALVEAAAAMPTWLQNADGFKAEFAGVMRVLASNEASAQFVALELTRYAAMGSQGMAQMEEPRLTASTPLHMERVDDGDTDDDGDTGRWPTDR